MAEQDTRLLPVHILMGGQGGGQLAGWNRITESDKVELVRLVRPEIRFSYGPEPPQDTHVLVGAFPSQEQMLRAGPELKVLVIPFAGVPATTRKLLVEEGWTAKGLRVHNIHHNSTMTAEMAVALALAAAKQLIPADRLLRSGDWSARGIPADGDPDPLPQMSLEGSTALVLGYGAVGRRVARAMAGLGMQILAMKRSAPDSGISDGESITLYPPADLHSLLPRANMLFVCLPETPKTAALLGAAELGMLPKGAVLINVARGPVVDEDALFAELKTARLFAAGIDVWYKYPVDAKSRTSTPVSAKHDFSALGNLVMSPHRAGGVGTTETETSRIRELAKLCNAAAEGGLDAIPNRVCLDTGY